MSVLIWIQTVDTLLMFMKEVLEEVNFEKKISRRQQKHEKLPSMQRVNKNCYEIAHFMPIQPC